MLRVISNHGQHQSAAVGDADQVYRVDMQCTAQILDISCIFNGIIG